MRTLFIVFVLLLGCASGFAQPLPIPNLKGSTVLLRTPYFGSKIDIDAQGRSRSNPVGTVSLHGFLVIDDVVSNERSLVLLARRVLIYLTSESKLGKIEGKNQIKLEMDLDSTLPAEVRVKEALTRLFQPNPDFRTMFADYWKPLALSAEEKERAQREGSPVGSMWGRPVFLAGEPLISFPTPEKNPNPEYPKPKGKTPLSVSTWSIIVNEAGFPELLNLESAAGLDYDFRAAEALAEWRFKPAMKDRKPVAILAKAQLWFNGD